MKSGAEAGGKPCASASRSGRAAESMRSGDGEAKALGIVPALAAAIRRCAIAQISARSAGESKTSDKVFVPPSIVHRSLGTKSKAGGKSRHLGDSLSKSKKPKPPTATGGGSARSAASSA